MLYNFKLPEMQQWHYMHLMRHWLLEKRQHLLSLQRQLSGLRGIGHQLYPMPQRLVCRPTNKLHMYSLSDKLSKL